MDKMIVYCGLDCAKCPAYIATQADGGDVAGAVQLALYHGRQHCLRWVLDDGWAIERLLLDVRDPRLCPGARFGDLRALCRVRELRKAGCLPRACARGEGDAG